MQKGEFENPQTEKASGAFGAQCTLTQHHAKSKNPRAIVAVIAGVGVPFPGIFEVPRAGIMKFLKLPDQKVRQVWEQSSDNGNTWKVLFDGLYVKAP